MKLADAVDLIRPAVRDGGTWADLGAGKGLFSRALAEILGPKGRVVAVDRDRWALGVLAMRARLQTGGAPIEVLAGDFRELEAISSLEGRTLDGALFANALHFVAEAGSVLRRWAERLRDGSDLVVVEYDLETANPWVPHPVSLDRLQTMAAEAGLPAPEELGRRPSAYHGEIYCAVLPGRPVRRTTGQGWPRWPVPGHTSGS